MQDFERVGVCLIAKAVSPEHLMPLRKAVDSLVACSPGNRIFKLPKPCARIPDVGAILTATATRLSGRHARIVRILAFDKTPAANWGVPWHQDRTIAVAKRVETTGYGPWTVKGGVPHVEPPQAVLEAMFSLRLHLDDCGETNGPLRIIPGSHRLGRLSAGQVLDVAMRTPAMICTAGAGDVLAMQALTIHSSEPAHSPAHRRVLHLDFATADLPAPLEWAVGTDQPAESS